MPAGKLDLVIDGAEPLSFVYKDANGDPIDLTGYSAKLQIRSAYLPAGILYVTLSTPGSGLTIPTPTNGEIIASAAALSRSALLAAGVPAGSTSVWDIVITNGTITKRLAAGSFGLAKVVTQV